MKVNIRNDAPVSRIRNVDVPVARSKFSSMLTTGAAVTWGGAGFLMGMLALTYYKAQTTPAIPIIFKSDDIPLVRIRNTD